MEKYVLKNITRNDISLGDLRIKIPAGKSRNLLGVKSQLTMKKILESEKSGSIYKRLKSGCLVKIMGLEPAIQILKTVASPSCVNFPQSKKSSIVIEVGEIDEDIKDLVFNEDEEYLKQLEMESNVASGSSSVPLVSKEE